MTMSSLLDLMPVSATMSDRRLQTRLLLQTGRLLLEYNESTEEIHHTLIGTARALTHETCRVAVSYRRLTVSLGDESPALEPIGELRYNTAVQARVHEILEQVRQGKLDAATALTRLCTVEADTSRYSRALATLVLGVTAVGLASLLGADAGAATVAGLATALGLFARQELGRRHFSLLTLPLTAAFIGALLGGLAIRLGWTKTPELAVIVPALMLVPGPHLMNGLLDLIDNHVPMALARFGLAAGILLASAAGVIIGVELTLPENLSAGQVAGPDLNIVSDMILAGIVTCGFAVFYNTSWRLLWMPILGGMAGHGLRFLALELGCPLLVATFLGGLTVGVASAWMGRSHKLPVAVIGFAGAVTMLPGLQLYRALADGLWLARLGETADPRLAASAFGNAFQGSLVVSGLALGFIIGARVTLRLAGKRDLPTASGPGDDSDEVARPLTVETFAGEGK